MASSPRPVVVWLPKMLSCGWERRGERCVCTPKAEEPRLHGYRQGTLGCPQHHPGMGRARERGRPAGNRLPLPLTLDFLPIGLRKVTERAPGPRSPRETLKPLFHFCSQRSWKLGEESAPLCAPQARGRAHHKMLPLCGEAWERGPRPHLSAPGLPSATGCNQVTLTSTPLLPLPRRTETRMLLEGEAMRRC